MRRAAVGCADFHRWDAQWPKGMQRALSAELTRESAADLPANEQQLRLLCIRAEQLTGTATPETDQALRRNWQLQQLTQGLGQANPSNNARFETLIHEWLAVGPVGDEAHGELLPRFLRCCHSALRDFRSGT